MSVIPAARRSAVLLLALLLAVVGLPPLAAHAGTLTVTGVSVTPTTVDVTGDGQEAMTFTATYETDTTVGYGWFTVTPPSASTTLTPQEVWFDASHAVGGTITAPYTWYDHDGSTVGTWTVSSVTVYDADYAMTQYDNSGNGDTFTVVDNTDRTGPVIDGTSFTAEPAAVDTTSSAANVAVSVAVKDPSGVGHVSVKATPPAGGTDWPVHQTLELRPGTPASDGAFTGTLAFPLQSDHGAWALSVEAYDSNWYLSTLSSADLQAAGRVHEIAVTTVTDDAPPAFQSLTVDPDTVNRRYSPTVTFDVAVKDDVSGLSSGIVVLRDPSGGTHELVVSSSSLTSGTNLDGTYRTSMWFDSAAPLGTWQVTEVRLTDGAGRTSATSGDALGTDRTFSLVDVADASAPTVGAVSGPASIDTRTGDRDAVYTVSAGDDSSGVSYVLVELRAPDGSQRAYGYSPNPSSGSTLSGTWTLPVTISRWARSGTWTVDRVTVYDNAGLRTEKHAAALGLTLAVTSDEDVAPPTVTGLSFTKGTVDGSTGELPVTVKVGLADAKSGLEHGSVLLRSADGSQWANGTIALPDTGPTAGTFDASLRLPKGAKPGDWRVEYLWLYDRAGNYGTVTTAVLHGADIGTQFPVSGTDDTTGPVLTAWTHAGSVDTSTTTSVPFSMSIDDATTGFAVGYLLATSPDGSRLFTAGFGPASRTSGTAASGTYAVNLPIWTRYVPSGTWALSLYLYDAAGNVTEYPGTPFPSGRTLSVTAPADTSKPVLSGLALPSTTITTTSGPGRLTVDIGFTDTVSGIAFAGVEAVSPSGKKMLFGWASTQDLVSGGTLQSGTLRGRIDVPKWTEDGTWTIVGVRLHDAAGNVQSYDKAALDARSGLARSFTVDAANDTVLPSLTSLSLSPSTVDTRTAWADLAVTAGVSDATSGVAWVRVTVADPSWNKNTRSRTFHVEPGATTATGALSMPKWSLPGRWTVHEVQVADVAGNVRTYGHDQLTGTGITRTFDVLGLADTSKPTVSGVTMPSTAAVVSSVGKEVDIVVSAADTGSGIRYGSLALVSPSGQTRHHGWLNEYHRRDGTAQSGTYLVSLFLPRYSEDGTWTVSSIELVDGKGNRSVTALTGKTVTVDGAAAKPAAPDYAYAEGGNTKLTASWSPPDNRGSALLDQTVTVRKVADNTLVKAVTVSATAHTAVIAGLTNGISVYAMVTGRNALGTSTAAATQPVVPALGPPDPPTGVKAAPGDRSISVAWTAPLDNGGAPVTGYVVRAFSEDGDWHAASTTVGASTVSAQLTGLVNGAEYYVSVSALNTYGHGRSGWAPGPVTPSNTAPKMSAVKIGTLLTDPVVVTFSEDVKGVSTSSVLLRQPGSTTNLAQAPQVCRSATGAVALCSGVVRSVELRPAALRHVAGQKYTAAITTAIVDRTGQPAVAATSATVRANRVQDERSLSGAGAWSSVAATSANGGSYWQTNQGGAGVEFTVSGTSVTWLTVTGPKNGKADVYVDGVRKLAGVNLYSSTTTYGVAKTVTGLSDAAHKVRIVALGQKGATSAGPADTWVAVDGAKGSSATTVVQKPRQLWAVASSATALGGLQSSSSVVGDTYTFRFRGTGVTWQTLVGTGMGTATVTIDGVSKGTVDLYAASAAKRNVAYTGLTDAVHTLVVKVASKTVSVDGFAVT